MSMQILSRSWHGVLALVLAFAAFGGRANAQDLTVGWNPRSGDVWVDTWLGDMNRYGARYREPFIDELVRYHGAPRPLVVELLEQRRWAPGDVYFACALASSLGRPCRYVVDMYEADRGQGWGVVAQRLGIKPGSAEFHRLKKGFVPTYDRWARPIELDDDLVRVFPDRRRVTIVDRDVWVGNDKARGNGNGKADRGGGKPAHAGSGKGKPAHAGGGGKDKGGKGDKGDKGGKGKSGDKGGQGKGKGKS